VRELLTTYLEKASCYCETEKHSQSINQSINQSLMDFLVYLVVLRNATQFVKLGPRKCRHFAMENRTCKSLTDRQLKTFARRAGRR